MKLELHKHIRASVLLSWVVAWNVLLGLSIWLNGGLGPEHVSIAAWPTAIALLASCGFCLLVLFSSTARSWALKPTSHIAEIRDGLWFVALLTGGMGLATFYGLLIGAARP